MFACVCHHICKEDVAGRTPAILKSGRQDGEFYRNMWETIERSQFWRGEIWNRRKSGDMYPGWLTITAVLGTDGQVLRYVGICSDITERKTAESASGLLQQFTSSPLL